MNERKEKLYKAIGELDEHIQVVGYTLVDRMLYMEERLLELEKLPFIKVHPDDPTKQKELPARKMYIPFLQQYNLTIKTILRLIGAESDDDEATAEFKKYLSLLNAKLSGE